MPFQAGTDPILQVQIMRDVDGVYRAKVDGEQIAVVSAPLLTSADKRTIAQALTLRGCGPSNLMVLI